MAAVTSVKQGTGAATGGLATTNATVTNVRLCTSNAIETTGNPCVVPASGVNRSYEAWVYLNVDSGLSGTLNNIKFYSDGTIGWTGGTLYGGTTATYVQPTGTAGTTGTDSSVATTSVATYTSGSPLSVTGTITATTGKASDFVVLQLDLSTSAVAGTLATETLTYRYDET